MLSDPAGFIAHTIKGLEHHAEGEVVVADRPSLDIFTQLISLASRDLKLVTQGQIDFMLFSFNSSP